MGSMHNRHENMPTNAVLADGCPRCDEHAENPLNALDDSHLARLTQLSTYWVEHPQKAATLNDALALRKIHDVMLQHARLVHVRHVIYGE